MAQKPWGGRFAGETEKTVEDFTTSLSFDRRLYRQDIAGSMAHARMLGRQGIITAAEAEELVRGLGQKSGPRSRPGSSTSIRPWKISTWPSRPGSPPR